MEDPNSSAQVEVKDGTIAVSSKFAGHEEAVLDRDQTFMKIANEEANKAVESGDGARFGAVIVRGGEIVVRAHNMKFRNTDSTAHAELTAIREACRKLNTLKLSDCELYSSSGPCLMCFGAIYFARIKRLVNGTKAEGVKAFGIEYADDVK